MIRLAVLLGLLTLTPSAFAAPCQSCTTASQLSAIPTLCPAGQAARGITQYGHASGCWTPGSGSAPALSFAPCPTAQWQAGNLATGAPICASLPTSTATTLPTSTTLPAPGATNLGSILATGPPRQPVLGIRGFNDWTASIDAQGIFRNMPAVPLPRAQLVRAGESYHCAPPIGVAFTVVTGGTTAPVAPSKIPTVWETEASYPTAARVLPWYASGLPHPLVAYRTAAPCVAGVLPPTWAPTIGATTLDGTCTWIAEPAALETPFVDGTATLQGGGFTAAEATSQVQIGTPTLMGPLTRIANGDNSGVALLVTRQYEDNGPTNSGEFAETLGTGGDGRTDTGTFLIASQGYAPSMTVYSAPILHTPTFKPRVVATIDPAGAFLGGFTYQWTFYYRNTGNNGMTAPGPVRSTLCPLPGPCRMTISVPPGITIPPVWWGGGEAHLVIAMGSDYYRWKIDELWDATDSVTLLDSPGEVETEPHANTSGAKTLTVRDPMTAWNPDWAPGVQVCVGQSWTPPQFRFDTYQITGVNCSADCRRCDVRPVRACALSAAVAPVWRADFLDVCDAAHVRYRRGPQKSVGMTLQAPQGTCQLVFATTGQRPKLGICDLDGSGPKLTALP